MADYDPFQEFQIGAEDDGGLSTDDREKFNPQKDETHRVSLGWWHILPSGLYNMDASQPRMIRTQILYGGKGIGYAIYKGPEYARLLGAEPQPRIATVVVSWPVFRKGGKAGQTDPDLFRAGRYEVLPWIFTKHKYQQVLRAHNTKPLGKGDLRITCTNAQYQHLEMGSYEDNYLRKIMENKPELFEEIKNRIEEVSRTLKKRLGTEYTLEELREKQGGGGGGNANASSYSSSGVSEVATSGQDFEDLINGLDL